MASTPSTSASTITTIYTLTIYSSGYTSDLLTGFSTILPSPYTTLFTQVLTINSVGDPNSRNETELLRNDSYPEPTTYLIPSVAITSTHYVTRSTRIATGANGEPSTTAGGTVFIRVGTTSYTSRITTTISGPYSEFSTTIDVTIFAPNYAFDLYLGPLTTMFVPPSSCFKDMYCQLSANGSPRLGWPTITECYPTGFSEPTLQLTRGYFSPGICPSGYSGGCSDSTETESGYNCCPSGFDCDSIHSITGAICTSKVQTPTFANAINATSIKLWIGTSMTVYAPAIRIRWQSSDLDSFPVPLPSTEPPQTTTMNTPSDTPSPALTTAAKIGIGITIPIVMIVISAVCVVFYRRRKFARDHRGTHISGPDPPIEMGTETPKYELAAIPSANELGARPHLENIDNWVSETPVRNNPMHFQQPASPEIPTGVGMIPCQK